MTARRRCTASIDSSAVVVVGGGSEVGRVVVVDLGASATGADRRAAA
jgi:hypothetical protein